MTGWWLPGGPIIHDGGSRLRIVPPESWKAIQVEVPRVPPSMNDNQIRSHWRGFHELKKEWQSEIETLLMVTALRRECYQRAMAGAYMRFPRRKHSQVKDTGNYTSLVDKALGDALKNYRAIPDDDEPHYFFGGVEFETEPGPERTRLIVFLQPQEG